MRATLPLLFAGTLFAQPQYDLLLKNGHVIDAKNNIDAIRDVAIKNHRIAALGRNIPAAQATSPPICTSIWRRCPMTTRSFSPISMKPANAV